MSVIRTGHILLLLASPLFGQTDTNRTPKTTELRKQQLIKMAKLDGSQFVDPDQDHASDFSKEIAAARESLNRSKKQFGEEHSETAKSLDNLATWLVFQRDYASARTHYEQALKIRKKIHGEAHRDVATSLDFIGSLLGSQGDHASAGSYYEQALQIRTKALGEQDPETIVSRENLAAILESQGDFAAAQSHYEQALASKRKALGENDLRTAMTLTNLAFLRSSQFDYAGAQSYVEQASKIYLKVQGPESLAAATSIQELGQLLEAQGNYAAARRHFEQVWAIHRKVWGDEHYATAHSMCELGEYLHMQGEYASARSYFEQALKINRKVLGDDYPETTTIRVSLASLLESLGDDAAARVHYEQAVQINRKVLGEDDPAVADPLDRLGSLLEHQGDHAAARSFVEQALKIRRKVLGEDHLEIADSLVSLGMLLHSEGDYDAARKHYEQALEIRKKRVGDEHLVTATSFDNLGSLLESQGDYNAARPYYEQSLRISQKVLGATHPDTAMLLENLAVISAATSDWEEALKLTDESRRCAHGHVTRNLPSLSSREQMQFLERNHADGLALAISLAVSQANDSQFRRHAAEWVLNGKGLGQEAIIARTLLSRDLTDPGLAGNAQRLVVVQQQLAAMTLTSPDPGQEQARLRQIEILQAELDDLGRKLALAGGIRPTEWIRLDQLRQSLAHDEVFIDLVRFDVFDFQERDPDARWKPAHYAALVISADPREDVALFDLGPAKSLDDAVAAVRTAIAAAGRNDGEIATKGEAAIESALRANLQLVADQVWKPLVDSLGGARSLMISPDSSLWLLPWAALPIREDKYLLEEYSPKLVVSGRDLGRPSVDPKTTPPCLFANPDFNRAPSDVLSAIKAMFPKRPASQSIGTGSLREKTRVFGVPSLPGTATEVRAIAPSVKTLTGDEPQSYTGEWALETVVKAVKRPKVLVLSTHGYFQSDQDAEKGDRLELPGSETGAAALTIEGKPIENPFLRCGLLFSGCNSKQAAGDDDGVLTGLEICGIDLRGTDLVVLSACETGVGQIRNGEGVAGLRQAFQLAGAQSVVATLWQIPDVESARIMNDFFGNLAAGKSKAEALRNAQLARIAARRERFGAAHPYFWAAYTLTGR